MKKAWLNSFTTFVIIILIAILIMPTYAYAQTVGQFFQIFLIILVVIVVIFLIFREVICWYWKINEVVVLLTDIRRLLLTTQKDEGRLIGSQFKKEATQTATNNFEPSKSALLEDELQELKSYAGEDAVTIPYATHNEWICVCGTHNPLDRSKQNQNCSNCRRNRDFILSEYRKKEMK